MHGSCNPKYKGENASSNKKQESLGAQPSPTDLSTGTAGLWARGGGGVGDRKQGFVQEGVRQGHSGAAAASLLVCKCLPIKRGTQPAHASVPLRERSEGVPEKSQAVSQGQVWPPGPCYHCGTCRQMRGPY